DHRDEIVGAHADERVRRERAGGGSLRTLQSSVGAGRREPTEPDDETRRARAWQEHAARHQWRDGFFDAEEFHEPALFVVVKAIHQGMHGATPQPASCFDAAWIAARIRW